MLLALFKKNLAAAKLASPGLPVGSLTADAEYSQLHYGDVEGIDGLIRTVEIDRTGNMVGFSPVERCIDRRTGEVAWIATEQVRNLRTTPFPFIEGRAAKTPTNTARPARRK